MLIYRISIPKYSKWQKEAKNGFKTWFSLDNNFWLDPKVVEARQICKDSHECYQMLISAADENGIIEMKERALKDFFKIRLGATSNNFDLDRRLNALLIAGLVEVESYVEEAPKLLLNPSKSHPKSVQPSLKHGSNMVQSDSKHSFETTKNQSGKGSFTNNTNKQIHISLFEEEFENWWKEYPKQEGKEAAKKAYRKSLESTTSEQLLNGVKGYASKVRLEAIPDKFQKMAQGWLNEKRWNDYGKYLNNENVVSIQSGIASQTVPLTESIYCPRTDMLMRSPAIELIHQDIDYYTASFYQTSDLKIVDGSQLEVIQTGERLLASNFKGVPHANKA